MYLSSDFAREVLDERKAQIDSVLGKLEDERARLALHLQSQGDIDPDQMQQISDFMYNISHRIECADSHFEARLALVEMFDLTAILARNNAGQTVIHISELCGYKNLTSDVLSSSYILFGVGYPPHAPTACGGRLRNLKSCR